MNEQVKQRIEENRAKHLRPANKHGHSWLSLSSMVGKRIIDLEGHISFEFGMDAPVFDVCGVVFEDGTRLGLEGEHDTAYIPVQDGHTDDVPGLTLADMYLAVDPDDIDEDNENEFLASLDYEENGITTNVDDDDLDDEDYEDDRVG